MSIVLRQSTYQDLKGILDLYLEAVATPGGLIRKKEEIDIRYVEEFLSNSLKNGLSLVAENANSIVGEIHAYTPPISAFQHLLTDLTIVVHPNTQGQGVGRQLFNEFLSIVEKDMPAISRIELYTRENNTRNVKFYESLGFINEGRQQNKIYVSPESFETPLHMAWLRKEQLESSR